MGAGHPGPKIGKEVFDPIFPYVLDMKYWERAGGARTWAELHGAPQDVSREHALRKCTYAGRPFGDETFVEEMERRFQRKWLRRPKKSAEFAKSA